MRKLTDELIEHAFKEIRADYEKRANEQGLEILDSCEEQWNVMGSLSDRQIAWLEKQLNGSWRPSIKPTIEKDEAPSAIPKLRPDVDEIPSAVQGAGQLLDAVIQQRLQVMRACFRCGGQFALRWARHFGVSAQRPLRPSRAARSAIS